MTETTPTSDPFNLHILFDPYIAPNIGSTQSTALARFGVSIGTFFNRRPESTDKELVTLLANSVDVSKKKDQLVEVLTSTYDGIREANTNLDTHSYATVVGNFLMRLGNQESLPPLDEGLVKYVQQKMENYILTALRFRNKEEVMLFAQNIIQGILQIWATDIMERVELIVPGGYFNRKTENGHLIGIYYIMTSPRVYTVVVANSGAGLQYHKHDPDGTAEVILQWREVPYDALVNVLIESCLSMGIQDPEYTVEKYYRVLFRSLNAGITTPLPKEIAYHKPQLSGSCSFFGLYYLLYYYFFRVQRPEVFDAWHLFARREAMVDIITELEGSPTVSSDQKNYLDLLVVLLTRAKEGQDLSPRLKSLYDKYRTSVENHSQIPRLPDGDTVSTELPLSDVAQVPNYYSRYREFYETVTNSQNVEEAINLFYDFFHCNIMNIANLEYMIRLYFTLKALIIVYNKGGDFFKLPRDRLPYTVRSLHVLFMTIIDKYVVPDIQVASIYYNPRHLVFILINILIKINKHIDGPKFLVEEKFENTNNLLDWINRETKFNDLFGVSANDFAENMREYQHYVPAIIIIKGGVLSPHTVGAWARLVELGTVDRSKPVPSIFPLIWSKDGDPKVMESKNFPTDFMYVISDPLYQSLFEIWMNFAVPPRAKDDHWSPPVVEAKALRVEKREEKEGIFYDVHVPRLSSLERSFVNPRDTVSLVPTQFQNDFNVTEMLASISDDEARSDIHEILERYQPSIRSEDNRRRAKTVSDSDTLTTVKRGWGTPDKAIIHEFDVEGGYSWFKCLVKNIKSRGGEMAPHIMAILMLNAYVCKYTPSSITPMVRTVINETVTEIESLKDEIERLLPQSRRGDRRMTDALWRTERRRDELKLHRIMLEISSLLMIGNSDSLNEICGSFDKFCVAPTSEDRIRRVINRPINMFYHQFLVHLFGDWDLLRLTVDIYAKVQSYTEKFLRMLTAKGIPHANLSSDVHRLFGTVMTVEITDTEGKVRRIGLIPREYFSGLKFNSGETEGRRLHELYYYYWDYTSGNVETLSEDNTMPPLEIRFSGPIVVYRKGTSYEKVTAVTNEGLLHHFLKRIINLTDARVLVWREEKSREIFVDVYYEQTMTFVLRDGRISFEGFEVVTEPYDFMYNRWTYDLPNTFLLVKGRDHKILLMNKYVGWDIVDSTYNISQLLKSNWINITGRPSVIYQTSIISRYIKDHINRGRYYVLDLHYTSLYPIFASDESLSSYLLHSAIKAKTHVIYQVFNNYIQYFVNASGTSTPSSTPTPTLFKVCANNPYKFYFLEKVSRHIGGVVPLAVYEDFAVFHHFSEYTREYEARQGYYPPRYLLTIDYDRDPIRHTFKYNDFVRDLGRIVIESIDVDRGGRRDRIATAVGGLSKGYSAYLSEFLRSFKDCRLAGNDLNPEAVAGLSTRFTRHIRETLTTLSLDAESPDNHQNTVAFLYDHRTLIYNLIEYIRMFAVVTTISTLCLGGRVCECHEVRKLRDLIDTDVVYNGDRSLPLVLFEVLFGSFVRRDQYDLYTRMVADVEQGQEYRIYQMLMGEGKTSVISPLLTFGYLLTPRRQYDDIILVMPDHLTRQSFNLIVNRYALLLDLFNVYRLNVERESNDAVARYFRRNTETNIVILDDASFKSLKLNSVEFGAKAKTGGIGGELSTVIRDRSLCIMDEIDSMMDPLTSELNYPIDYLDLDPFVTRFSLYYLRRILETWRKRVGTVSRIHFPTEADSRKFVDEQFRLHATGYALDHKAELDYFLNNGVVPTESAPTPQTAPLDFKYVGYIRKVHSVMVHILTMLYNKDYGFGTPMTRYEKNDMVAIPYRAVGDPVDGSEFTDPDVTLCLTILTYYYHGLRAVDVDHILKYTRQVATRYKNPYLITVLFGDLVRIFEHYGFSLIDVAYRRSKEFKRSLERFRFDPDLTDYYLKFVIVPKHIRITAHQYNCSFLDVVTGSFTRAKVGFSGTVNLVLPALPSPTGEFTSIVPSDRANGSVISAIVGYVNENRVTYIRKETLLEDLYTMIITRGYNVLIDTGAFLQDYTPIEVIRGLIAFAEARRNEAYIKKKYIYIDSTDDVLVYDGTSTKLGDRVYSSKEVFMFYDNKHTVGIDIRQPYHLSGVVTVDYFNTLTSIEQGAFRLRNINYGHLVDFLASPDVKLRGSPLHDTVELLEYLKIKEEEYNEKSMNSGLLQNIKYLRRQTKTDPSLYMDNVYYERVQSEEDLRKNLYAEYVQRDYCQLDDKLVADLCRRLLRRLQTESSPSKVDTQRQREKAVETAIEVAVEVVIARARIRHQRRNADVGIRLGDLPTSFTIGDYVTLSPKVRKVAQYHLITRILETYGIYLSPKFLEILQTGEPYYYEFLNGGGATDILVDIVQYYDFYYFKYIRGGGKEISYMIIAPEEFLSLFTYLTVTKGMTQYNVILKHKLDMVRYNDVEDVPDAREVMVKFFLGNKLTYEQYYQLFDLIVERGSYSDLEYLREMIPEFYNCYPFRARLVDFFLKHKSQYRTALKDLCRQRLPTWVGGASVLAENVKTLLHLMEIDIDPKTLTEADMLVIIERNGIVDCASTKQGGGWGTTTRNQARRRRPT